MQPVRKASEDIYSSQSGLKQRKTRIPRCSSPTTLSQNSQLHSLHGGHGCLTNMTSQIHEITNMQFTQVLQLRNHKLTKTQKCRSRSQCNTENHSSSTPISSFADSRIECRSWLSHKHDIPNSQICKFLKYVLPDSRIFKYHFPGSCIFKYHLTGSQLHVFHKSHGCLTSMTLQIPRAQFISLRPKTTQNIRTMLWFALALAIFRFHFVLPFAHPLSRLKRVDQSQIA